MNSKAIYAGTFDPITLGHLDVLFRAARIFPDIILAVADSSTKQPMFSLEERVALCKKSVAELPQVEVDSFSGLLVDYARAMDVHVLVRGLRAFSDFEFEFQMALTNRKLEPSVETIFLMPKADYSYVSSSTIREVASMGGNISDFVPAPVAEALRARVDARGN